MAPGLGGGAGDAITWSIVIVCSCVPLFCQLFLVVCVSFFLELPRESSFFVILGVILESDVISESFWNLALC